MKTKISFFLIYTFFCITAIAQVSPVDSLKSAINNSKNDSNKVNSYLELAQQYLRVNQDTSIIYANNAIKLGKEINFYKGVANSYRQIAIVYYMKGEYDEAIKNFEQSLKTWEEAGDESGIGRAHMNIGIIYFNIGQYDKALENYLKATEILSQINDIDGVARANNNIANLYYNQGGYTLALEYSFKSLNIHEELNNESLISTTLYNIGNIYRAQYNYSKALEYYEKAQSISEKLDNKKEMADIYSNIGNLYRSISKADTVAEKEKKTYFNKAISYFEKSLPLYSQTGYKKGIAMSYNDIGLVNLDLKDYSNALLYLKKSYKIYEETGDKFGISELKLYTGRYYHDIKKYSKAISILKEALNISNELNSKELTSDILLELSRSYFKTGDYKNAYLSHFQHKKLSDDLRNDEKIQEAANQELNYQVNKKQKEMEMEQQKRDWLAQEEIKKQSMYAIGAFIALGLVAVVAFFIFRSYRIKRKSNILLEKQRDEILQKNEELLQLNEEILAQRELTEQQRDIALQRQKEIMDSIQYANRIQTAVLPQREMFVELVPDYFIYFKPRDIVSGDFYWLKKLNKHIVVAAADCTGHGVPGAFMSLLGIAFLNEIVNETLTDAAGILNLLRERIMDALHQTWKDDEAKDGMDIALSVINIETKELQYAGAYNPLYIFRNGGLIEKKADKMPIGIHIKEPQDFTNHSIQLKGNDTIYMFSDGYIDQFGGNTGSKFKTKRFKELLFSMHEKPMKDQKEIIDNTHINWKGEEKQLDDILVIGMRF
jgi:serine phosphatase RsbU (regulator of sigma subunit)